MIKELKKIERKRFNKFKKEFSEDFKRLNEELTEEYPKEFKEDLEKLDEKFIEIFAKTFHIHVSGNLSKLSVDKLLKYTEQFKGSE